MSYYVFIVMRNSVWYKPSVRGFTARGSSGARLSVQSATELFSSDLLE